MIDKPAKDQRVIKYNKLLRRSMSFDRLTGTAQELWFKIYDTKFFTNNNGNTLSEQIVADEQRNKLLLQIATLENKMRKERQPRRKFDLHQ